jgi:glycosyltransferase involved in cell wall biosynthesis
VKIGIDATVVFSEHPSGLGVYTVNMVNALFRLHQDMVVWTIADAGFDIPDSCLRPVMQPLRFLGNRLYPLRPLWLESYFSSALKREGVDVLWSTVPSALSCSPVPHLLTVHDLIPLKFPHDVPSWVRWSFAKRVLPAISKASAVIADSAATRDDLVETDICLPSLEIVYPAFDAEHFRQVDPLPVVTKYGLNQTPYLLYVGNASPRKNLEGVVRAFKKISENYPHVLVLAGAKSSVEQARLERLIAQQGLGGRVKMLNYVPYKDLPGLYCGAACAIYLSHYEGFGLPVLEAMACGAPVVASSTTSIPEVSGDAALLVDPGDADAAADAIRSVLIDSALRSRMIEAGLAQARKFSWSSSATQVLNVLHSIVEARHA